MDEMSSSISVASKGLGIDPLSFEEGREQGDQSRARFRDSEYFRVLV
jgi:hypothetical protein